MVRLGNRCVGSLHNTAQRKVQGTERMASQPDKPTRYTGPPMDLANMRENGVRALLASCLDCTHRAEINVDDQPGHLAVKSFEPRTVCGKCGSRRIDVRPAWGTRPLTLPKP